MGSKKDDELGFQLLMSTLNKMTERIALIEESIQNMAQGNIAMAHGGRAMALAQMEIIKRIERLEKCQNQ